MTFNTFEDSDYLFNSECEMRFLWRPLVTFLRGEGKSVGLAFTVEIRKGSPEVPYSQSFFSLCCEDGFPFSGNKAEKKPLEVSALYRVCIQIFPHGHSQAETALMQLSPLQSKLCGSGLYCRPRSNHSWRTGLSTATGLLDMLLVPLYSLTADTKSSAGM